jgi:hypothetical protein
VSSVLLTSSIDIAPPDGSFEKCKQMQRNSRKPDVLTNKVHNYETSYLQNKSNYWVLASCTVQPKDISLSLNHIWMDQQHTSVTHGSSTDPLALPEYTLKQNFATSHKPNISSANSSDDQNRVIVTRRYSGMVRQNRGRKRGKQVSIAYVHNLAF